MQRYAVAISVADSHNRERRGSEHRRVSPVTKLRFHPVADVGAAPKDGGFILRRHGNGHNIGKRRAVLQPAKLDLLGIKSLVILPGCQDDDRVARRERLDDRPSGLCSAAGTPDNLRDQRKATFPCALIAAVQELIGGNDADKRHVFKIQTLGDHLRTNEDRYLLLPELR